MSYCPSRSFRKLLFIGWIFSSQPFVIFVNGASSILDESLSSIQTKALNGDSHYQGALALFHKHGERGLTVDMQEAKRWASIAAEKEGALGLAVLAAIELEKGKVEKGRFLYDEAYLHSNLRILVKGKDPLALYCLGMMEIDNPPINVPKALRHIEESAEMGFATAQATLGMIYFTGIGVAKNSKLALKWCSLSARNKVPLGMFYLGMAYSVGDGVDQNDDFSIRWIQAAAVRELTMAQLTLGMKYALGEGTDKNLDLAVQWLRRASIHGSAEAALQLRRYENLLTRVPNQPASYKATKENRSITSAAGKSVLSPDKNDANKSNETALVTPAQSPELDEFEINYFQPNENDEVESPVKVAKQNIALNGETESSIAVLEKAAGDGEDEALAELGKISYKKDQFKDARKWFEKAAESNHPEALRYLGILHFLGQGVEVDYKQASQWFEQAVRAGDLEASRYLRIVSQFK